MFKQSRRKIIAVIMLVFFLLLSTALCLIYGFSYAAVYQTNQKMLERHIDLITTQSLPGPGKLADLQPDLTSRKDLEVNAAFKLATFYSVQTDANGQITQIHNPTEVMSDAQLAQIALQVLEKDSQGTYENLVYRYEEADGSIIIAFMDNTLIQQSITTLFRSTLLFGAVMLIPVFFLARYAASWIVKPLEESHRRQKQFICDAGHELKTPVSVVQSNAEILAREIGKNQWLENIQYENARMAQLIGQLLELAKHENVQPQMEPVDLTRIAFSEVLPFESVLFEHGLLLESDIADHLTVQGNADQLRQLVSILLDNAASHAPKGSTIQMQARQDHKEVVLSVINAGEPIPEKEQALLFERFYRLDPARTQSGNHYGLGLSIAKAIVTAHKGNIQVVCVNGRVEFRVVLPCV